jgi:hypothetical protein
VTVTDLGGNDLDVYLNQNVHLYEQEQKPIFIIAPQLQLDKHTSPQVHWALQHIHSFWPHLSTEHPSVNLTLSIYRVIDTLNEG